MEDDAGRTVVSSGRPDPETGRVGAALVAIVLVAVLVIGSVTLVILLSRG